MEKPLRPNQVIRFGVFEMDLSAGELRKKGLKVKLLGQPYQILSMLIERPGEVVSREELRQKLWSTETFVDFDHSLNTAVNKIREALGDSAENPCFIETVPRRGYRFIAPVENAAEPKGRGRDEIGAFIPPLVISRAPARALFAVIQVGYLLMYGAAFYYMDTIARLAPPLPGRHLALILSLWALCGLAARIYFLAAVGFDYADSGRLFHRLFAGILVLDLAWAATPLLLYHRLGQFAFVFVVGLAFLPFSQRSLLFSAYSPRGGPISAGRVPTVQ